MNSRPLGDFGNCRGPEGGREVGALGRSEGGDALPHTPSTAKGAIRHPAIGCEIRMSDPRPCAPKPSRLLEVLEGRPPGLGTGTGGQGRVCTPRAKAGVPGRAARCTCSVERDCRTDPARNALLFSLWLFMPVLPLAGGVCAGLTVFLISLAIAISGFAVCLLVTTSAARADGASGRRETDGDA